MASTKDSKIFKIAVEMAEQNPHLTEFEQVTPLEDVIKSYLDHWNIKGPASDYSLQFNDPKNENFVNEKNRFDVKNGTILKLTYSPGKLAQDILMKLKSPEERHSALKELVKLSTTVTFVNEFINKNGKDYLVQMIENDDFKNEPELLGLSLEAFVEIMNHGILNWDSIERKFVERITQYVNCSSQSVDLKVLTNSLAIIENILISGTKFSYIIETETTLPNVIGHIQFNNDILVRQNALALINAFLSRSEPYKRKAIVSTLSSKRIRDVILNKIINNSDMSQPLQIGSEMAHQLYMLQSSIFNILEERVQARPSMSPIHEAYAKEKIAELCRLAFDIDQPATPMEASQRAKSVLYPSNTKNSSKDDYLKLGFTNRSNPVDDFNEVPPGLLALDFMTYFAVNHNDTYVKVVLENSCRSEHECPFVKSSIDITKLICEIFKTGDQPSDEGKTYYPMLFDHDHPLEEFFSICVPLLNKTWKEMKATVEDFVKVFFVLKQQLTRALSDIESVKSFEKFKVKLSSYTYSVIMNLWQKERSSREEWENNAQPIIELRQKLEPEIKQLIKKQRLQFLIEGTMFGKYSNKGVRIKDKFWYCRLSPKMKVLHYGDCEENKEPSVDELPQKVNISDIKQILVGKNCSHMKEGKTSKKTTSNLAFSLVTDSSQGEALNFVAPNEKTLDYWIDGINSLLGNEMNSKQVISDLKTLLTMEIKMRLLDTEGIAIPKTAPKIPPPPENYDFKLKF